LGQHNLNVALTRSQACFVGSSNCWSATELVSRPFSSR
jgi:hypothetical protein